MHTLISELTRLYLAPGMVAPGVLEPQFQGGASRAISLVTGDGLTRALVIAFRKTDGAAQHWNLLCSVANALQAELGLPAPAVSISGTDGFHLWLSFEALTPLAQVRQLLTLLQSTYFPDIALAPPDGLIDLPPCKNPSTGRWAAFINPGLGASFADESGLEMAPPLAGQVALLAGLQSISQPQLAHALSVLGQTGAVVTAVAGRAPDLQGVLLKDATLEQIVSHLQSKNIEPTFRHVLAMPQR